MSLAGNWELQLDPDDRGIKEAWFQHHDFDDTIKLPGTTDEAGKGPLTQGSEPGSLTRVHKYYGAAWYQREIEIPSGWEGKTTDLFLERVIWESWAWVDGRELDIQDSLDTPHIHHLGKLTAGKHLLTLRISNMMIHPVGVDGHNFTEQTQTIWNGAVGKIELRASDELHITSIQAFPDADAKQVKVHLMIAGSSDGTIHLSLREKASGKIVAETQLKKAGSQVSSDITTSVMESVIQLPDAPKLWDEFAPNLYVLDVMLDSDVQSIPFGFRKLSRVGQQLAINSRPMFIRGNMDHCICPLTGYPPTDVQSWKNIFAIYKSYGMNQMRCHSWTPPEAAFEAADEMGIYIQAEIFWLQYPLGSGAPVGAMKVRGPSPASFSSSDQSPDDYVRAEMRRVIDTYGNHPSLVFFVIGNELGKSDWPVTAEWIKEEKAHDPRHLYAASTAREITPSDDFSDTHAVPKIGWVRDRLEAFNDWDYEKLYSKAPVPIIAHELGQWPTYPRWSEIDKYTGVVRARDLEECESTARKYNVLSQDEDFHRASGALAIRLYKDEMESHLRTPSCSGFSTLDMQDYPGQGEALVGWLDAFYDSKGTVTPERFRRWCNSTVPLARLPKYVYTSGEPVTGLAEVAHYGPHDLDQATATWRLLAENGSALSDGQLQTGPIKTGGVTELGKFAIPLTSCQRPCKVRLEIQVTGDGQTFANDWDLWIFPDTAAATPPTDILVTDSLQTAKHSLAKGQKILLLANNLGGRRNKLLASFKPVYWSEWYFPGSETLGALVQNKHAALSEFPTEDHYDWQWADLCKTGRGFVVDRLSADFRPIVQPVPDFHLNHKYATVFELATAAGGKLMVSGYDLETNLENRPAAAGLRRSLLSYMATTDFHPTEIVGDSDFAAIFPEMKDLTAITPPAFKNASIYVTTKPGTGIQPWTRTGDNAQIADNGFDYAIKCDGIQNTGGFRAWYSPDLHLDITVPKPNLYDLYVHFVDGDRKGRQGTIRFAGRTYSLPAQKKDGAWLKLDVIREDCLDKHLVLDAHADSGPDIDMDEFALVPRE